MTAPVLLVDLSSIGHPIWHMSQSEPDPDYTSQRIVAAVLKLAADHPHAAICCDAPGPSFRKDIDPTYKANRPAQQAPLYHQIRLAKEKLVEEGFPVWEVEGFEGDDVIATATKKLYEPYCGAYYDVLIASSDKDLLALVSDTGTRTVEVYTTRNGDVLGPAAVKDKLGVDPCQVVDYLCLVGDASDNIKGARGIGPKTAAALLNIWGDLDSVCIALDADGSALKPAQVASLEELRPRLDAVRALVTMRTDVPLDVGEVFQPRVPKAAEEFMEDEIDEEPETGESVMATAEGAAGPVSVTDLRGTTFQEPTAVTPPVVAQPTTLVPVVEPAPAEWEHGLEPRSMGDARQARHAYA